MEVTSVLEHAQGCPGVHVLCVHECGVIVKMCIAAKFQVREVGPQGCLQSFEASTSSQLPVDDCVLVLGVASWEPCRMRPCADLPYGIPAPAVEAAVDHDCYSAQETKQRLFLTWLRKWWSRTLTSSYL